MAAEPITVDPLYVVRNGLLEINKRYAFLLKLTGLMQKAPKELQDAWQEQLEELDHMGEFLRNSVGQE